MQLVHIFHRDPERLGQSTQLTPRPTAKEHNCMPLALFLTNHLTKTKGTKKPAVVIELH